MSDWLTDPSAPAVLITVARVDGSGPREAGTKMLVTADRELDTIGGGHLEMRAIDIAREMLAGQAVRYERFALGPSLGQCCGGVVYLLFERVDTRLGAVLAALRERRREDCWRLTAVDGPACVALFDMRGQPLTAAPAAPSLASIPLATPVSDPLSVPVFARDRGAHLMQDAAGRRWMVDPVLAPRAHLTLFGAGHVGAAIVRALAELPCTVTWVDEREDMFPADIPANVTVEASELPEACVAQAPPNSSYLVLTHNHALDQRLTETILQRQDVYWFGLIGSKTKRMQFEHRLQAKGIDQARIDAMVCPIGIAGITNKAPAVIAASVCAQLLGVWEQQDAERMPKPLSQTATLLRAAGSTQYKV
ncbi:XdhC protein [Massilia sp. Root351]|uniref:xanthine dehydrogenase accessory protein XdhC n=1 Tax=Massilia sp. Root351 TaxID=1736522 RepID=UPI0007102B41|nr:xanthine dehydrogenase accessory protein XdhC [Massilia sp. Root351]KQV91182.1 XdhC protein [Massilia sp. Root351]